MKLFTHNLLICPKKKCGINSFPLKIVSQKVEKVTTPVNEDFLISLIESERLNWAGLVSAGQNIGLVIPPTIPADYKSNKAFLQALWDVLMDCQVIDGELICPLCQRHFPIKNGIPNMLLNEQEF
ncbi:hypothetical protein EIN_098000 [Entamoeba invadens IP1]|uniref:Trm112p-like protein n=1 Tax=Entamoeba invadens IP1 TaxID=370355 RepID=A0A0A1U474_ENTIV|nr:hypothetical protein EIN_098000 [Entamoeba invadens IP1]ELP87513.1 hypothetical protein EIN_098000 [Entamoeba invadens IP1]|eukprot:XP_004254284.1 hypothetical protein EIN_098000 [Entamoeba invadens IP1]